MTITQIDDDTVVLDQVQHFYLRHIFECGQCFRWDAISESGYIGVAFGRVLEIHQQGSRVTLHPCTLEEFNRIWCHYLDLNTDYGDIKQKLAGDPVLEKAMEYGYGLRLLQQDPWECLISFIISANNRIPRIKNIIEQLSSRYGQPISYNGHIYYAFPSPDDLAAQTAQDISLCRCGYRAPYIAETARLVADGYVDLEDIAHMNYNDARRCLMELPGVGPKVADCVLLFSMNKREAFPVDVWIKRCIEQIYLPGATTKQIRDWARVRFGGLAGIAQQYLFYYMRENAK